MHNVGDLDELEEEKKSNTQANFTDYKEVNS